MGANALGGDAPFAAYTPHIPLIWEGYMSRARRIAITISCALLVLMSGEPIPCPMTVCVLNSIQCSVIFSLHIHSIFME